MSPTRTPTPGGDESGTAAAANPVGDVEPSQSTPVSRSLSALQRPWRDALSAIGLLVTGVLVGASLTLTLLLTNVVRSLPPSAVLPRPNGSPVVVIHAPYLDPGQDTVTLPPPQDPDYRRGPKDSPIPRAAPGGMGWDDDLTRYGSGARLPDPPAAGSNPCQGCRASAPGGGRA